MKVVGPKTNFCLNLAHSLCFDFVEMDRRVFPDGEINPRIEEAPEEVILVNTLSSHCFDPNRYIMEYIFSIKNLKERGTELIILVMPYLPYSRQDAVFREGESFTSKYMLDIFKYLGIKNIFAVTFHLHRQRAANLIEGITLFDVSGIDALRDYITPGEDPLFLAPDEEAEKWARKMAVHFQGEVAVLQKRRDTATGAIKTSGEISEGRNVIIVDDMISTGSTILKALKICTQYKSRTVMVAAVHGIFSRSVRWDVPLITTNTVENPYAKADVTPYIAKAIAQQL
ncbi:MAG: ribose-phosphate pyrophosphokinase [Theionarchaea archaeon]|nr:ribose-phosphate pyrophosphokinase [Theionarchaea archaeon]